MGKKGRRREVEHVRETSADLLADSAARLREIFPEVVTEGKIDFEKLRGVLGGEVDDRPERYSFTWAGKRDAIRLLQTPSRATLVPVPKESINFDATSNVFIEGENLEVLKLLYKSYAGRVKMIYIDPPYNTGNDFIYPDNFADPLDTYLRLTGQKDSEGNLLTTNPETSGRYHSAWLSMMYPRLFVARQLLREDGAIFISIDDHEVHNLRLLMSELFGEENFVGELVWEGAIKNDSRYVSISHDYIVCFAKNREHLKQNDAVWRTRKTGIEAIYAKVEEVKLKFGDDYEAMSHALADWYVGLPKKNPAWFHRHYNRIDKTGVYFAGDISWPGGGGPRYEVLHPVTEKPVKVPASGWRFSKPETMQAAISEGRVDFGADETKVPTLKRYLHETEGQVLPSVIYKDRRAAMKRLRTLMGADVFENPKDEEILGKLIEATTSSGDLVLDFFAGSCAAAHAVLNMNCDDGGDRRFLVVQLQEATPEKSGARSAGFATISDVGKERIRRVIKKVKHAAKGRLNFSGGGAPEDLGFKIFKLAESNYRRWKGTDEKTGEALLAEMEKMADRLVPGWKPDDVIYEVALKEGYSLTSRIEQLKDTGDNRVYLVTDADKDQSFRICLDDRLKASTMRALKLRRDDLFICRDAALTDEQAANLALQCKLKTI